MSARATKHNASPSHPSISSNLDSSSRGCPVYLSPELNADQRSAAVWENVDMQNDVDELLQSRAAFELKNRLQHWNGDYLPARRASRTSTASTEAPT